MSMMTPEQLMMPRYKVIAGYPRSESDGFAIGDIITDGGAAVNRNQNNHVVPTVDFLSYPAIFALLQWWEERSREDMPQYVKIDLGGGAWQGKVGKAKYSYVNTNVDVWFSDTDEKRFHRGDTIPATEQEYLNFINPTTNE